MPYKESEKEKVLVETVSDDDIDTEAFLLQIQQEVELSRNFVNPKREYLRSNVSKYIDQTIDDEKIPMNTSYAMINLSLAVELMDSKEPIFTPRWLWDDEIAENLTDVAKFDYTEMWMDRIAVQWGLDRRMFGAEIKAKSVMQNAIYWKWMEVVSDETGNHKDVIHALMKKNFLSKRKLVKIGWKRNYVNIEWSTKELSVKRFTKYLDDIYQFFLIRDLKLPTEDKLDMDSLINTYWK